VATQSGSGRGSHRAEHRHGGARRSVSFREKAQQFDVEATFARCRQRQLLARFAYRGGRIASASARDNFRGYVGHPLKDPFNSRFARKIAATMPEKDNEPRKRSFDLFATKTGLGLTDRTAALFTEAAGMNRQG
jgi:hypothetical protein